MTLICRVLFCWLLLSWNLHGNESVSDEMFHGYLTDLLHESDQYHATTNIARSGHPDAVAVLKLASIARSRTWLSEQLGISIEVGTRDRFNYISESLLVRFLAIAGDDEAFEKMIEPIEKVIGLPEITSQEEDAMYSTLKKLGELKLERAIPYFAALLYYDGSEVTVLKDPDFHDDLMYLGGRTLSGAAGGAIYRWLRPIEMQEYNDKIEREEINPLLPETRAMELALAKEWWQNNSSKYGVENPDSIRAIFGKAEMKARRAKSALQFDRTVSDSLPEADTNERSIDTGAAVDSNKETGSSRGYWLAAVALLAFSGLAYLYIRRSS